MDPLKILIESLLKAPKRADSFMIKWFANAMIDNKRRRRRTWAIESDYDHLLASIHTMLATLIGRDLAPVVNNTCILLYGNNSPFFITWNDMVGDNEQLVFGHLCMLGQRMHGYSLVHLPPIDSIDFTHVIMRFMLLILLISSNDGASTDVFMRVHDVFLVALQRAELEHPLRRERFARINTFLKHLSTHSIPKWDPYTTMIPMI